MRTVVTVTLFHNPRCSKSRQTLELLRERGIEPVVVEYLKTPPDRVTLREVLEKLGRPARDMVRRKEALFAELDLERSLDDEEALLAALEEHPALLERPIVVVGNRARIGRPPESVLEIL